MANIERILDECIDRLQQGDSIEQCLSRYPGEAAELEPLLRTAASLREAARLSPADHFKSRVRAQALFALQQACQKQPRPSRVRFGWARPLATVAAGVLAMAVVSAGTVAASADSLPGQPLYGVKTVVEKAQLAITPSEVGKAKLLAGFADKRVAEIAQLVDSGDVEQVKATSVRMAQELKRIRFAQAQSSRQAAPAAAASRAPAKDQAAAVEKEGPAQPLGAPPPKPTPAPARTLTVPPPPEHIVTVTPPPGAQKSSVDWETARKELKAARNAAEMKEALRKQGLHHRAQLEKLLARVPEKDRPAIQEAIRRLAEAYDSASAED
ncbi:MAG: hypothetical protein HYX95_02625 [Chloroflexi bacterium]|nr:hypothetical protein [Chloroflexota bacterium]